MKQIVLCFLLLFTQVNAYSAGRCDMIFSEPISWNASQLEGLLDNPAYHDFFTSNNLFTKIFRFKTTQEFSPQRLLIAKNYDEVVYNFYKRMQILNFFKTGDLATSNVTAWVERKVLQEGLRSFVADHGHQFQSLSTYRKILAHTQSLLESFPLLQVVTSASHLPHVREASIPTAFMAKILVDGMAPHLAELQKIYPQQKNVDIYRRTQQALGVMVTIATIVLIYNQIEDDKQTVADAQKRNIFDNLDALEKSLDKLDQALDQK